MTSEMKWPLTLLFLFLNGSFSTVIIDQSNCPLGWEFSNDQCIRLFHTPLNYAQAESECAHEAAELVNIVKSSQIDKFLIHDLEQQFEDAKHLGLNEQIWLVGGLQAAMHDPQLAYDLWLTTTQIQKERRSSERKVLALQKKQIENTYEVITVSADKAYPFVCALLPLSKIQLLYEQTFMPKGVPVFIEEPSSSYHYINRADGHFITLPCRAFGQPEPTIRWYRSGIEEIDVASANSSFIVSGGSLLIPVGKQVQSEVSTYHCTASNNLGTIRSASTVIRPAFIDAFRNSRLDAYPLTSRGGGTRLDCQAPAHYPKSYSYSWMVGDHTDQFLQVTERVFISMDGTLYFSYNRKTDATSYACTLASSSVRSGQYGPFFNLILPQNGELSGFPPRIDEYMPQVFPEYPIKDQAVNIECFAYGFPAPKYKWSRIDGRPFSPRHKSVNFGRVLRIENVQAEDAVRYRCTASNDRGVSTAEIHLIIQSPPAIICPLINTLVSTNSTVRFSCPTIESHSSPKVHTEWFKNGQPIVPVLMDADERRRFILQHNELAINNVRVNDAGAYQCRLSNEAGSVSSSARLNVQDSKPRFHPNVFPRRVFVVEGSKLALPCLYFAMPHGKAKWKRLSRKRDSSGDANYESIEESGIAILRINSFTPKDVGDYECRAENELGEQVGVVELALMSKPKVAISQAVLTDQDGYGLRLTCEAELECSSPNACPEAHFNWEFNEKNAQQLSGKLKVRQYARSVNDKQHSNKIRQHAEIDAPSAFVNRNFGRFACSSVFGSASAEIEPYNKASLQLSSLAPTHVKILDIDSNSIKMSWRLPATHKRHGSTANLKIDGYVIEHRTAEEKTWRPLDTFLTFDRIVGSFLIRDLYPNTKYQFRIRSRSTDGVLSLPSTATSWVTTPSAPPNEVVKNLRWKVLDNLHLLLEWDPIEKMHKSGANLRYNVTFGDQNSTNYNVVDRPSHVITFKPKSSALTSKHDCQVVVVGVQPLNDLGQGPAATDTVVYLTEEGPKRFAKNVKLTTYNATHLNITWDWMNADECENVHGAQINCLDEWEDAPSTKDVGPNNAKLNYSISAHLTSFLVGGLDAWTQYKCSITAFDQLDRRGQKSKTSNLARTAEPAPKEAPEVRKIKLHETLSGYTTLIDWSSVQLNTAPNSTKNHRGYRVFVYITETSERPVVLELLESELQDSKNPTARIDGLKLMYYYKLQIAGFNKGGEGPKSEPTTIRIGSSDDSQSMSTLTTDFNCWLTIGLFILLRMVQ